MHQISYVDSEFILPAVIYIGGNRHPLHIYANNNGNVCVMVCEVPIFNLGAYSVLNTVVIWAKNIGGSALFRDYIGSTKEIRRR